MKVYSISLIVLLVIMLSGCVTLTPVEAYMQCVEYVIEDGDKECSDSEENDATETYVLEKMETLGIDFQYRQQGLLKEGNFTEANIFLLSETEKDYLEQYTQLYELHDVIKTDLDTHFDDSIEFLLRIDEK